MSPYGYTIPDWMLKKLSSFNKRLNVNRETWGSGEPDSFLARLNAISKFIASSKWDEETAS